MFKTLKNKPKNPQLAFSLAELVVTVFVLTIGLLSFLLYFTNALNSAQMARDITVATTHAETIFEEMRTRNSLSNITSTNWIAWAAQAGLNTLPSESVSVTYINQTSNPLQTTASVGWTRKVRVGQVKLATEFTK